MKAFNLPQTRTIDCPRCGQDVIVSTSGSRDYIMEHKHTDGDKCDATGQFVANGFEVSDRIPNLLYMADRSPTGRAGAALCTLESGAWGYVPDGQRTRCACVDGEKLYATAEIATLAAMFRWRCNGNNRDLRSCQRPVPAIVVTVALDGR